LICIVVVVELRFEGSLVCVRMWKNALNASDIVVVLAWNVGVLVFGRKLLMSKLLLKGIHFHKITLIYEHCLLDALITDTAFTFFVFCLANT